jgi:hypothetical protein
MVLNSDCSSFIFFEGVRDQFYQITNEDNKVKSLGVSQVTKTVYQDIRKALNYFLKSH